MPHTCGSSRCQCRDIASRPDIDSRANHRGE
ncbi:hypothetical protein A2U01_0110071, partial [Trifolium medium]|nr:hypothetical protein [Trifolium medium]